MAHLRRRYSPMNEEDTLVAKLNPQAVYLLEGKESLRAPLRSPVPPQEGIPSPFEMSSKSSSLSATRNTSPKAEDSRAVSDSLLTKAEKLFLDRLMGCSESIEEDEFSEASWIISEDMEKESRDGALIASELQSKSTTSVVSCSPSRFDATSISTRTSDHLPRYSEEQVEKDVLDKLQMAQCSLDPAHAASAIMRGIRGPDPSHPPRSVLMPRRLLARLTPLGRKTKKPLLDQEEEEEQQHINDFADNTLTTEDHSWRRWTPPRKFKPLQEDAETPKWTCPDTKGVTQGNTLIKSMVRGSMNTNFRLKKSKRTPKDNHPRQESREPRETSSGRQHTKATSVLGSSFSNVSANLSTFQKSRDPASIIKPARTVKYKENTSKSFNHDQPNGEVVGATAIVEFVAASKGSQKVQNGSSAQQTLSKRSTGNKSYSGPDKHAHSLRDSNPLEQLSSTGSSSEIIPIVSVTRSKNTHAIVASETLGLPELIPRDQQKATHLNYFVNVSLVQNNHEGIETILNQSCEVSKNDVCCVPTVKKDDNLTAASTKLHKTIQKDNKDMIQESSALPKIPDDSREEWTYIACCADSSVQRFPEGVDALVETSSVSQNSLASSLMDVQGGRQSFENSILETLGDGEMSINDSERSKKEAHATDGKLSLSAFLIRHLPGKRKCKTPQDDEKKEASPQLLLNTRESQWEGSTVSDHSGGIEITYSSNGGIEELHQKHMETNTNAGKKTKSKGSTGTKLEQTLGRARNIWKTGSMDVVADDWSNNCDSVQTCEETNSCQIITADSIKKLSMKSYEYSRMPSTAADERKDQEDILEDLQTSSKIARDAALTPSTEAGNESGKKKALVTEGDAEDLKNLDATVTSGHDGDTATNKIDTATDQKDCNGNSKASTANHQINPTIFNKRMMKLVIQNPFRVFRSIRKRQKVFDHIESLGGKESSRLARNTDSVLNNEETEPTLLGGVEGGIVNYERSGNYCIAGLTPCQGVPSVLIACLRTELPPHSLSTSSKDVELQRLDSLRKESLNPIIISSLSDPDGPGVELVPQGMTETMDIGMKASASNGIFPGTEPFFENLYKDSFPHESQDLVPKKTSSCSARPHAINATSQSTNIESDCHIDESENRSRIERNDKIRLPNFGSQTITRLLHATPTAKDSGAKETGNADEGSKNKSNEPDSVLAEEYTRPIIASKACAADLFFIRPVSELKTKQLNAASPERMVVLYPLLDFNPCDPELIFAMNDDSDSIESTFRTLQAIPEINGKKHDGSDLEGTSKENKNKSNELKKQAPKRVVEYLSLDSLNQEETSPAPFIVFSTCGNALYATETALSDEESLIIEKKKKKKPTPQKLPNPTTKPSARSERRDAMQSTSEEKGIEREDTRNGRKIKVGTRLRQIIKDSKKDKENKHSKAGVLIRRIIRKMKAMPPKDIIIGEKEAERNLLKETRRKARDSRIMSIVQKNKRQQMKYSESASRAKSVKTLDFLLNVDWESQEKQNDRRDDADTRTSTGFLEMFSCGCS